MITKQSIKWITNEFKGIDLGDKRRNKRSKKILKSISKNPAGSVAEIMQDWGAAKAAYRFFENPDIEREKILEPHIKHTKERIKKSKEVVFIQDTTCVIVKGEGIEGFGPIGRSKECTQGMLVHTVLAINTERNETLGVVGQEVWVRNGYYDQKESGRHRRERNRESECWQHGIKNIQVQGLAHCGISIFDRGGDIFEVLKLLKDSDEKYVIRVSQNRLLDDGKSHLYETIRASDASGMLEVRVPAKAGHKERIAKVSIRPAQVVIKPPRILGRSSEAIVSNVVEAREEHPPQGCTPLHWMLHTSEPIDTLDASARVIKLYTYRWKIEEFHKGLKTGCHIEKRSFATRKRLETFLGFASVISIMLLKLRDNAKDETSRDHGLNNVQLMILRSENHKLGRNPTAQKVMCAIAQMGGFMNRKGDGHPGWITLWRGMIKILLMEHGFDLAKTIPNLSSIIPELVGI